MWSQTQEETPKKIFFPSRGGSATVCPALARGEARRTDGSVARREAKMTKDVIDTSRIEHRVYVAEYDDGLRMGSHHSLYIDHEDMIAEVWETLDHYAGNIPGTVWDGRASEWDLPRAFEGGDLISALRSCRSLDDVAEALRPLHESWDRGDWSYLWEASCDGCGGDYWSEAAAKESTYSLEPHEYVESYTATAGGEPLVLCCECAERMGVTRR
jgi:hypothetical protein